jgi:hypothetical protein
MTIADALAIIISAFERAGKPPVPGTVGRNGLTLFLGGEEVRLQLVPEALLYPTQEAYERGSDAFIGEADPAGFNGMEEPF